jgi:hypothetical protein
MVTLVSHMRVIPLTQSQVILQRREMRAQRVRGYPMKGSHN